MTTIAAQALMDAKMALDAAKDAAIPLRATLATAQNAVDEQDQIIYTALLDYQVALNALLIESGNAPDAG